MANSPKSARLYPITLGLRNNCASRRLRNRRRPRRLVRFVVQNAIAIVARDDFVAAAHVSHDLRTQRHEARSAGSVASFGDRNAVANARADPFVKRTHWFWELAQKPFAFTSRLFKLLLLHAYLFVKRFESLFHIEA